MKDSSKCNLLPPSNSSFLIARHWENIPETFVLNGSIGLLLFIAFLWMTKRAWDQTYNDDSYISQGLLAFLYGYRDPQRWYVIPRFEFLRRTELHHDHDLNYPNIYVPPKLPLANPIELLAFESKTTNSLEDRSTTGRSPPHEEINRLNFIKKTLRSPQGQSTARNDRNCARLDPLDQAAKSTNLDTQTKTKSLPAAQNSPLDSSFFYPSILTAEQLQASYLSRRLNRIFSIFFKVTDADIIYAKGIDAYEYLLFQRHLIFIMLVTNILCLGVILPIHWFASEDDGDNLVFETSFQRTTIKNMSSLSMYYWAHIFCSVIIVVVSVIALNSYRSSIITRDDTQLARRTVLIGNIPKEQRSRQKLTEVLRKYFASSSIEAIQFVYDTSKLEQYQMQLDSLVIAKQYCMYYKDKFGQEITVKPTDVNENQTCNGNCRLCSYIYVCCCYWPKEVKQPGIDYYTEREQYYRNKIDRLLKYLVRHPSEHAFVTFKSNRQTRRVMEELAKLKHEVIEDKTDETTSRASKRSVSKSPSQSLAEVVVKGSSGKVVAKTTSKRVCIDGSKFVEHSGVKAHDPLDVNNNPHVRSIRSPIMRRTSPDYRKMSLKKDVSQSGKEAVEREALLATGKLEGPIAWSVRYAPHPDNVEYRDLLNLTTTSKYTIGLLHALMIIIFIFITTPNVVLSALDRLSVLRPDKAKELTSYQSLVINYVTILLQIITTGLLPSLVTLISKQIPYEDTASKNHSIMWKVYLFLVLMVIIMPSIGMSSAQALFSSNIDVQCLFPTDNGAYFVNYVLTSTFLSTLMELIKPIDILFYTFILWTSRSVADFEGGRQLIEREFSVGMQHTNVLLVFSAVMTYAISCPLIAPVGLVYLSVKHAVDHYHLFYVYFTKKVDKNLQTTVIVFVRVALLLMLFQTTVAISINTRTSYFSFMSQIVFWLSLVVFTCNFFLYCTARAGAEPRRNRFQRDFCACFYMPRVMEDLLRLNAVPASCVSRKV